MAKELVLRTLAALTLALPLVATAEQARTKQWVNVRAGPAGNYPTVMRLPPGSYVEVYGCTSGYRWCDVIASDGQRGWAQGGSLYYAYDDRMVPVIGYGPSFGIPITPFVMVDYWGSHYRHRSWYGHRQYWGPGYGYGSGTRPVMGRAMARATVTHRVMCPDLTCRAPGMCMVPTACRCRRTRPGPAGRGRMARRACPGHHDRRVRPGYRGCPVCLEVMREPGQPADRSVPDAL